MKKGILTLGIVVGSLALLTGQSYAAEPSTSTATAKTAFAPWRSKVAALKKKLQNKGATVSISKDDKTIKTWHMEFGTGNTGAVRIMRIKGIWGEDRNFTFATAAMPAGGMFIAGHMQGGNTFFFTKNNEAVEAALKANDYNAFLTALKADEHRPDDAKDPTQDEFNKMVTAYNKQQAIKTAIENNDYSAYVTATTPTQAEFAQIVAQQKLMKAIDEAIKNKDYSAYITALKSDTNRPADATLPTQEEFNKMVEQMGDKVGN